MISETWDIIPIILPFDAKTINASNALSNDSLSKEPNPSSMKIFSSLIPPFMLEIPSLIPIAKDKAHIKDSPPDKLPTDLSWPVWASITAKSKPLLLVESSIILFNWYLDEVSFDKTAVDANTYYGVIADFDETLYEDVVYFDAAALGDEAYYLEDEEAETHFVLNVAFKNIAQLVDLGMVLKFDPTVVTPVGLNKKGTAL